MFISIVNLKFASDIEADAMQAYAEYELINKLPGILSIEVVRVTNLHSVVINKFQSQKHAEESKDIIINKMKQNPNIKIEIFEGERLFIKEKPVDYQTINNYTDYFIDDIKSLNKFINFVKIYSILFYF